MKAFFEEYGRTIVTVLIILGIILIGYIIGGNGTMSTFGRFTTSVVDSLTSQASCIIKDSPEFLERTAHKVDNNQLITPMGNTKVTSTEKDGTYNIDVEGKSVGWATDSAWTFFRSDSSVPWGKKSVLSFDISTNSDSTAVFDFNVTIRGVSGNDAYGRPSRLSVNGEEESVDGEGRAVALKKDKKYHMVLVLTNSNEEQNPSYKDMVPFTGIMYKQDGGKIHYTVGNIKYGVAE